MKKLEEIPKKNIFEVPDGYFDRLPGMIQTRLAEKKPVYSWNRSWSVAVRYALVALLALAVGLFWYIGGSASRTEKIRSELATLSPGQLVEYLNEQEIITDDMEETIAWSAEDLDDLENAVYSGLGNEHQEIEKALNEYDAEL